MIYDINKLASVVEANPAFNGALFGRDTRIEAGVQYVERRAAQAGAGVNSGAFYGMYVDSDSGDTYLQGGTVTGGNGGTKTFDDYKVIDSADTPPLTNSGKILYVKAACTATVEDGVMLPGCAVTAGSTSINTGTSVPANHVFTVADPDGYVYTEIGRWTDADFLPSYPGNIVAKGCIGAFLLTRDHV